MTSTVHPDTRHPISRVAGRAREVLAGLADVPAWAMSADDQRDTLRDLAALEAQVAELTGRVLLAGERNGIAEDDASPSAEAWFARHTRTTRQAARRDLELARSLDGDRSATRKAYAAGDLTRDQAVAVSQALDGLVDAVRRFEADRAEHPSPEEAADEPATVPPDLLPRAERALLHAAREHDARDLRRIGRHLLAVVAPDLAEEAEGRRLAAQERAASARSSLVLHDNGDGTHSGRFTLPDLHAAILTKALDAFCSPRVVAPGGAGSHLDSAGRRVPRPEQRGQALCALLERLPATALPASGGLSPTVVVTIDWDALTSWYAVAGLDTGERVSAGEARRLLCGAGVVPAVLGGGSEVLDLGREQRLFSRAQRRTLALEHPGCQAAGCTRPAGWCEAHHLRPWSEGGASDLANAVNLCPWHHHRAHDPRYELRRHPDGSFTFHRRT